jgi:2-C-methyl-D-erythritol 4-phosphate cytidylyltransferase
MKKYAVIVAGGSGTRMGSSIPKQFLNLRGKPVLWYAVKTFLKAFDDLEIILVIAKEHVELAKSILETIDHADRVVLTTGGRSRFHSVQNGLQHIRHPSIVFVHDGVRCLLSTDLIQRCYEETLKYRSAIPAVQAIDSIRIETLQGNEAVDRQKVWIIQTPQTFYSDDLKAGYEQEFNEAFTDEASVVERLGIKIHLVEGETRNIKITNPIDLIIAGKILEDTL